MIKDCHDTPNQYISSGIPKNNNDSREVKSRGIVLFKVYENPNITLNHDLKKKVGTSKYNSTKSRRVINGKRSNENAKNKTSEIKNNEPGNPKKTNELTSIARKSFGHNILSPLISVIKRVLKRRVIASTNKKALVDNSA